jgi:hypothetical protein
MGKLLVASAAEATGEIMYEVGQRYMSIPRLMAEAISANVTADRVFNAVVNRTVGGAVTGVILGGWIGGEIAFSRHVRQDDDIHGVGGFMAGIGGAIVGASVAGWMGAEAGNLSYNIDVSVPFADVFNGIGQTAMSTIGSATNMVGGVASSTVDIVSNTANTAVNTAFNTALDFASQHEVAVAVTTTAVAVAGLGYMAYNQLSEDQKDQLTNYPARLLEGKDTKQLQKKLNEEEIGLERDFEALEKILQKEKGNNTDFDQLNEAILKKYRNGEEIEIEKILELTKTYEKIVVDLSEPEMEEIKKVSVALIASVSRCGVLKEMVYSDPKQDKKKHTEKLQDRRKQSVNKGAVEKF